MYLPPKLPLSWPRNGRCLPWHCMYSQNGAVSPISRWHGTEGLGFLLAGTLLLLQVWPVGLNRESLCVYIPFACIYVSVGLNELTQVHLASAINTWGWPTWHPSVWTDEFHLGSVLADHEYLWEVPISPFLRFVASEITGRSHVHFSDCFQWYCAQRNVFNGLVSHYLNMITCITYEIICTIFYQNVLILFHFKPV